VASPLFLDTGYVIALSSPRDRYHDCVSFVVMRDRAITKALTTDAHISQAGFEALLQARAVP